LEKNYKIEIGSVLDSILDDCIYEPIPGYYGYRGIKSKNQNKEYQKKYCSTPEYKKRRMLQIKEREQRDPLFKLSRRIRSLISSAFKKKKLEKGLMAFEILGCDFLTLKNHFESLFTEGMTWGNMGLWHIDHKRPLAIAKTEEDLIKLNHYTNLQPLWSLDNLKKGARYE
jgi:hypothetical protein